MLIAIKSPLYVPLAEDGLVPMLFGFSSLFAGRISPAPLAY
jgi:hypothetical protein